MRSLSGRLARAHNDDGITLIEVLIAMMIFAMISTGVIYTMISVLSVGRDSRARQAAANLAAEAVDRAREELDIFALQDGTYTRNLNGDTFRVTRDTEWVSDPAADIVCGGGGGALRYKRVNITVTWDNMRPSTEAVRSDTVVDPKSRINDPLKGTILVSVLNGDGLGTVGVTVTAQPITAAGDLTGSPLPSVTTDAAGCAYLLRVEPGSYRVTIAKTGYRDVTNVASPTVDTGVAASATASVAFNYDRMATFRLTYAAGVEPVPLVANAMSTSFLSTYGSVLPAATGTGNPRDFTMFPFASGYDIIAGRYEPAAESSPVDASGRKTTGCLSPDPGAWASTSRQPRVAAPAAGLVSASVPTGVVTMQVGAISNAADRYVKAVSAYPPSGSTDPGCAVGYQIIFSVAPFDGAGAATIALPYGTWELYRGGVSNPTTRIAESEMALVTLGTAQGGSSGTVTLVPQTS